MVVAADDVPTLWVDKIREVVIGNSALPLVGWVLPNLWVDSASNVVIANRKGSTALPIKNVTSFEDVNKVEWYASGLSVFLNKANWVFVVFISSGLESHTFTE